MNRNSCVTYAPCYSKIGLSHAVTIERDADTFDAVTIDADTFDAVTIDADTFDAVTIDPITIDAVTFDADTIEQLLLMLIL